MAKMAVSAAKSSAMVAIATILASGAGLVIALGAPFLLTAQSYAIFAMLWALAQWVSSLTFDWLRFGTLRYAVGADPEAATHRRALLGRLYVIGGVGVLALASIAAPMWSGLAAVLGFAACSGIFEGYQALMRAKGHNGAFIRARVLRSVLGILCAGLAALVFGQAVPSLVALALSFPLALLIGRAWRHQPVIWPSWPPTARLEMVRLLRFGLFAALTTNLSLLILALYRLVLLQALGAQGAAGAILAFDLSQRAIVVLALAVNVVVMQSSIRVAEAQSAPSARAHQAGRQFGLTLAVIAPAALGLYLIGPMAAQLIVAPELRADFLAALGPACLGGGLLAMRLFSIDPLFVMQGDTWRGIAGAVATTLAIAALFAAPGLAQGQIAWLIVIAMALGVVVALAMLGRGRVAWPVADLIKITCGCVMLSLWVTLIAPDGGGMQLGLAILGGVVFYGATLWVTDLAGLRRAIAAQGTRP